MYSQRDFQNFHNHIASVLNVKKGNRAWNQGVRDESSLYTLGFLRDRVTFFSTTIIL